MKSPLVSVVIVTFNSSKTIIETLDSIKGQTYDNIELIISDDNSKDDTTGIVSKWLDENGDRFVHSQLVKIDKNTGVSGNCNRGVHASSGEWIKILAGDDKLAPESIETFIKYALKGNDEIFICDIELFSTDNLTNLDELRLFYDKCFECAKMTQIEQHKEIYYNFMLPGPAWFYSRKLYDSVGGYDEKYPMMEEWPFALNVLKKGYRFSPIADKLVRYRVSQNSLSHNSSLPNYHLFKCLRKFFFIHQLPYLFKNHEYSLLWSKTKNYIKTSIKFILRDLNIKYN